MKKQWETSNRFQDLRREPFNFAKSSGVQDVKNHLWKSETSNEISKRNHSGKYVEQKFSTRFKPATRNEFQRRTYSFENSASDGEKETIFPKKDADKKKSFDGSIPKWSYLPSAQCVAQEKQMAMKLKEIREIIEEIQKTSREILKERQENSLLPPPPPPPSSSSSLSVNTKTRNWPIKIVSETKADRVPATFSSSISRQLQPQIPRYEPNSSLKRKLVPIRFTSSFTVEVGSPGKTFTEEVTFQKRLVPAATQISL